MTAGWRWPSCPGCAARGDLALGRMRNRGSEDAGPWARPVQADAAAGWACGGRGGTERGGAGERSSGRSVVHVRRRGRSSTSMCARWRPRASDDYIRLRAPRACCSCPGRPIIASLRRRPERPAASVSSARGLRCACVRHGSPERRVRERGAAGGSGARRVLTPIAPRSLAHPPRRRARPRLVAYALLAPMNRTP